MIKKGIIGKSIVLLVIAGLAALLIIVSSMKDTELIEKQVLPVKTAFPEKGDLEKLLRISGFIESETMVTVLPRIGGTLTDVFVEMGDEVDENRILAKIDSEPYELSYNQAKAAFDAAKSTFDRISSLYLSKSVSQQNYDEAKANYDALMSTFELAELNLSYTDLKAPVKGVIVEKHVSRGSMVAPQVPVVTISDIDNLNIKAGIPEIHYSFFQKNFAGMKVKVSVPALENKIFSASITNMAPYIRPQTRNFVVKCSIKDEEKILRPGMFVQIDFVLDQRTDVYYLPYTALSGGERLWSVDEENRAGLIDYTPSFGNEEFFQVSPDFSEYRFILEGQNFLSEGQSVREMGDL